MSSKPHNDTPFIIIAVLLLAAGLTAYFVVGFYSEVKSKSEWAELSNVYDSHRGRTFTGTMIVKSPGFEFCGVSHPDSPTIWILLNPKSSPYYKQMPQERFYLSQSEYDSIESTHLCSETTLLVLKCNIKQ